MPLEEKTFQVSLNVGERIAIKQILKSKRPDDISVLLDINARAITFDLTPSEKEQVKFVNIGGSETYDDAAEFEKEFVVSESTVRYYIEAVKDLVKDKKVSAGWDTALAAYKKLCELK